MAGFAFSRVVIVESLDDRDFRSGEQLHGYLTATEEPSVIPIDYFRCESVAAFLGILESLVLAARDGSTPLLHIETHGRDDGEGLVFQDESFLSWGDLATNLVRLNKATKFNLLVVVAACFGAHFLLSEFSLRSTSPFWGLIGPTDTTHGPELLGSFRTFYRNLLTGATAHSVFSTLERTRLDAGELLFESAEALFSKGIKSYAVKLCSPAAMRLRARKNQKKLKKLGKKVSLGHATRSLKQAHDDVAFDVFANNYFMLHDIPENRRRFADTLRLARARFNRIRKR